MMKFQQTIQNNIYSQGLALHSGTTANVVLKPMAPNSGLFFQRTDLKGAPAIKVTPENVTGTNLSTTLGFGENKVSTVEHLLAALISLGIDNLTIEVDGPELPVFDGSAAHWVTLIKASGTVTFNAKRSAYRLTRPFKLAVDDKSIEVLPAGRFSVEAHIDFNGAIGRQAFYYIGSEKAFTSEICPSRTFCLLKDVEMMQSHGLALGGSLDNAVVVSDDGILNPDGLRFQDEFVRHKILDFIGDISIIGAPIMGRFIIKKPGHELNAHFLKEAINQPELLQLGPCQLEERKKSFLDHPHKLLNRKIRTLDPCPVPL
ncbi:MAG: UDP-3-O-acyl-N-acetylglucosamine deacetylase [Candidatus Adiutrix sp.]